MKKPTLRIEQLDNYSFLMADDIPHSVFPPPEGGYWKHMISDKEPKKILILGLGGGTIAKILLEKYPQAQITGVDYSASVLKLARKHLGLDETKVTIKIADAFDYVLEAKGKYDLIIVDLINGHWYPLKVFSISFIKKLMRILEKQGQIYINAPNMDHLAEEVFMLLSKEVQKTQIGPNNIYSYG